MPSGSRRRFAPPPEHIHHRRSRVGPIYADENDAITDEAQPEQGGNGFSGIRSRSRFIPPPRPIQAGHGVSAQLTSRGENQPDPAAGRTQFGNLDDPLSLSEAPDHRFDAQLGDDDYALSRAGILDYERDPLAPINTNGGRRASDLVRWSDAGPVPRPWYTKLFLLRKEFMQDAQSFTGEHTEIQAGAKGPTSPVRMRPPRSNRLTERSLPGSFGQLTEVLT